MKNKIVIDASAILALLQMEKGHEKVAERLDDAVISSVNFSEVITVLARNGFGTQEVVKSLQNTFLHIVEFDARQAIVAASFDKVTKKHGLSLGDRACLALAKCKGLPVLTADRAWEKVDLGVKVRVVR